MQPCRQIQKQTIRLTFRSLAQLLRLVTWSAAPAVVVTLHTQRGQRQTGGGSASHSQGESLQKRDRSGYSRYDRVG